MEKRQRIIEEGLRLFMKYGIRNITMDELAKHLGISKRTIYEQFKNKDSLLLQCIKSLSTDQKKRINRIMNESAHVIDSIYRIIGEKSVMMRNLNPLFLEDMRKFHPAIFKLIHKRDELEDISLTEQLLIKGKEEGIFLPELNTSLVTRFMWEMFRLFGDDEVFPFEQYDRSEMLDNIFIVFIRGLCTANGIEILESYKHADHTQTP
ncbi:MAG: TetR/AcrR family transcriptional regulator [Bacteroidales bacterium]|nr:MAG: TetR/AcrR family transcriptional regulator [Bacteroidales bacterium]